MYSDNSPLDSCISVANLMLEKFQPEYVSIYSWLNKFESVADYVGIPDHRMGEFLYSMLKSPECLNIKKDDPTRLSFNYSYQEIKSAFLTYYGLLDAIKLARNRFKFRIQYKHETIEKYAASLQNLFIECSYMGSLKSKLTKQFLDGLLNKDISISVQNFNPYNALPFKEAVKKAVELQKLYQNKGLNEQQANRQETNKTG
ncbi:hypothetical protein M0804_013373 [Polistes exclamans]|nr:hypothetical protein M0804_013373 [Polistes exclamans]